MTATSLAMCTVLLVLLGQVSKTVHSMRGGEVGVRDGLALAVAVREQYIHLAHTIIDGRGHLEHYERWVGEVQSHAEALRHAVPAEDLPKVDHIASESKALDTLFKTELIPALDRGDHDAVVRLHDRAEVLSSHAVQDADALATFPERRMAGWHTEAIDATRMGLLSGVCFMALIVVLSAIYTRSIRRSVVEPLGALAAAARQVGSGAFPPRLGAVGEGEFEAVAQAYDKMIDELRAREERLLRAERMAVVGQLAAGVAHEINNPIGVLRGYLRTMSPTDPPEELREELQILDDEAAACQRIAEDLLEYARAQELQTEPVVMHELLRETIRRFAESGEAGGRDIAVDAREGGIVGDAGRIRQVVLNLVRNAVQASPPDAQVEVTGAVDGDGGYEVRVVDRGPGVAAADTARIFEPFFSKRKGGSGLGLAVCQGIVRAHGGDIGVEDREGGGSIFRFVLPSQPSVSRRSE